MKFGAILISVWSMAAVLRSASASPLCTGDCNGNGRVTVDELVVGVDLALGNASRSECTAFDPPPPSGAVEIDELVTAVAAAVRGCPGPIITTVAGSGLAGYNQDGLPPLETHLYLPQDMTYGPDGKLYIVDWNNHRIRRINAGVVETVAGSGEIGPADDGAALHTQFNHPTNVEFDRQGRMIIAAWHNSLVKRLDLPACTDDLSQCMVTNLAGTGARAFGGDGGPGNAARLDLPSSVAIDSNGNIVISDQANFRLRLLEPNGTIHTICGTGTPGYSGDGGPAVEAQLDAPRGQSAPPAGRITIDSLDRIYIADSGNHCIRMIDSIGAITTIAGDGEPGYSGDEGPARQARFNTPSDVAIAADGTLYIADTMNHVVRSITPDGRIHTVAGTGTRGFSGDGLPAYAAQLDRPYGVATAPNGDLYVADTHNQRVRLITAFSTGPTPPPTPSPTPVIVPCTDVPGSICTYAGTGEHAFNGDGHHRLYTTLYWPFDMEFTPSGRRWVLDWNNHKVREIQSDETFRTWVGTDFVGDGPPDLSDLTAPGAPGLTVDLNHPTDLQEFPNGDLLFVAWHNHKLRQLDPATGLVRVLSGLGADFAGDGGPAIDARLNQPARGVFDAHGNFFVVDQRNQRIRVFYDLVGQRAAATVATVAGTGVCADSGALCASTADCGGAACNSTPGFNGDGPARQTRFSFPTGGNPEPTGGITIDASGVLYFADTNNHRIRRLEFRDPSFTDGTVTTIAGTGSGGFAGDEGPALDAQLNFPQDVELGPDGNLYFCDANNNRVRMIDLTNGTIHTIAGTGTKGYAGDGGSALDAQLNRPFGLAFDANGDLYVSDTFNGRIRRIKR
jgi:sugar lactone lactonase YvrE